MTTVITPVVAAHIHRRQHLASMGEDVGIHCDLIQDKVVSGMFSAYIDIHEGDITHSELTNLVKHLKQDLRDAGLTNTRDDLLTLNVVCVGDY